MVVDVPGGINGVVLMLDHQPLGLFFAALGSNQNETATEFFAGEPEFDFAVSHLLLGALAAFDAERAAVPNHHGTRPVISRRNIALEIGVAHGVVFGLDGHALIGGIQGRAFGNGPGFEHAINRQAKVVMQAAGSVLLHNEGAFELRKRFRGGRFRSAVEAPFAAVLPEAGHISL